MKEKLVGQEESFRKKSIDFDAEVLSLRKANAELEVITVFFLLISRRITPCVYLFIATTFGVFNHATHFRP